MRWGFGKGFSMTVSVSNSLMPISRWSRFITASVPLSTDYDPVMPDFNFFGDRFDSLTVGMLIEMLSSNYTVTFSSIPVYRGRFIDVAKLLSANGVFMPIVLAFNRISIWLRPEWTMRSSDGASGFSEIISFFNFLRELLLRGNAGLPNGCLLLLLASLTFAALLLPCKAFCFTFKRLFLVYAY